MMKIKYFVLIPCFFIILALASCASEPIATRALTEKENNVRLAEGNQATTMALNEKCKALGTNNVGSMDEAKILAASRDADVAQVMYVTNNNGRVAFDVRLWQCPVR